MLQCLKREPGFYRYLWGLTGPIALQNLITFTLGLMDTLMVSWLGNSQMAAVTTANVPVFLLISIAMRSLTPFTSARRSGSSSMIRKVSALNFFTILLAKAAPMPLIAPEPRYRSIASVSSGAFIS